MSTERDNRPPAGDMPTQDFDSDRQSADTEVDEPAESRGWPAIPGYEFTSMLGSGGMGAVYSAKDLRLGRTVAIKVLKRERAGEHELERFRREAESIARISHPNIVQIYEIGEHRGSPYLALEYCPGGSLAAKLDGTPWPPRDAATLVETLARAVHAGHAAGIVHRDLKPQNILLMPDGSPKITDFGLAKQLRRDDGQQLDDLTLSGAVVGTPAYMAPEQAMASNRAISPATDVHALGAILYELLAGRPPFRATTLWDTLEQVVKVEPVSPRRLQPKVPVDLETICLKCLEKDPKRRFQSAEELAQELRRFLDGEPIRSRPNGLLQRMWKWARRRPAVAGLLALLICVVVAGISALAASYWQVVRQKNLAVAAREIAQEQEGIAKDALARLSVEQIATRNRLAESYFERGLQLCEANQLEEGLLWFLEALQAAPDSNRPLVAAIRRNLSAWDINPIATPERYRYLASSADQRVVFLGDRSNRARLWDANTGQPLGPLFVIPGDLHNAQFTADGRRLLVWTGSTVQFLDPWQGNPLGPVIRRSGYRFAVHPAGTEFVAYSNQSIEWIDPRSGETLEKIALPFSWQVTRVLYFGDGKRLIAQWYDSKQRSFSLRVMDRQLRRFVGPVIDCAGEEVRAYGFSPSGKLMWLAGKDKLELRRAADLSSLGVIRDLRRRVQTRPMPSVQWVRFSRDEQYLITFADDSTLRAWRIDADGCRPTTGKISGSAYRWTCLAADDRTLRVTIPGGIQASYDIASGFEKHAAGQLAGALRIAAIDPTGNNIFAYASKPIVEKWNVVTGKKSGLEIQLGPVVPPQAMALSPDGKTLVVAALDCIGVWNAETGEQRGLVQARTRGGYNRFHLQELSADSRFVLAGRNRELQVIDLEKTAVCLTVKDVGSLYRERDARAFFNRNGSRIACVTPERIVLVDFPRGAIIPLSEDFRGELAPGLPLLGAAFSPDGAQLATGSADGVVNFWDATDGKRRHSIQLHTNAVVAVGISPDGRALLTGSMDNTLRLWDLEKNQPLGSPLRLGQPTQRLPPTVAIFSPGGKIAVALHRRSGTYRILHVATGKPLGPVDRLGGEVTNLAIEPNERFLLATVKGTSGLRFVRRAIPQPLGGDIASIRNRIERLTGLTLDDRGSLCVLDPAAWHRLEPAR